MNRAEHLQWCKDRELEYIKAGNSKQAFVSMGSDLRKHLETANHLGIEIGMRLFITDQLNTTEKMRKFIEGFR